MYQDALQYIKLGKNDFAAYALRKFIEWVDKHPETMGAGLKPDAQAQLANLPAVPMVRADSTEMNCQPGDIVFLENEPSDYFYVIKSGNIKISKLVKGHGFILGILGPGEIFGEMALIEEKPRFATAQAHSLTKLMRLSAKTFLDQVGEQVLQRIFTSLARRIYIAHQRLAVLRIPNATARLYLYLDSLIKDINMRNPDTVEQVEYLFEFNYQDLKKMTGLIKLNDKKIQAFLNDPNLEFGENTIKVENRMKLKDSILRSTTQLRQSLRKMSM